MLTSASDVWVQRVCAANMWGQVNGQYVPGLKWALVGLGRAGVGRAEHVARCDAATSRPWALIGLRPQHGSHRVAHGGPALLVHGPKAGSMVDRAHRHFSSARLMCTGCRATLLTLPLFLCFFHGALLPATCSPASSRNGSDLQLRWGKASLCHGDCNGGVRATDGAS